MKELSSSNSTSLLSRRNPQNALTLDLLLAECNMTGLRRTLIFCSVYGSYIFVRKNKSSNGAGVIVNHLKIGLGKI